MSYDNRMGFNQEQSQKQTQQLSFEQQQSLQILQVVREDLGQMLLDMALENPLMKVEDTRHMLTIDPMDGVLATDSVTQNSLDYINPTPYDREDSHQAMISQLRDESRDSLQTFLLDQIMCYRQTRLRDLMVALLDELDEQGFLTQSQELLQEKLACTAIELVDAITLLQQLDPVGVASADLREYWMLQTENDDAAPNIAYVILESYFSELVQREFQLIADALEVSLAEVQEAVAYYQVLSRAPMSHFSEGDTQFIEPDVYVRRTQAGFEASYNLKNLPEVTFDSAYFQELSEVENHELQEYIQAKKQEALAVMNSLKRREQTLLQVSQVMFNAQLGFFQSKGHQVEPLTMSQVAQACGFSPSTISRTIQGKYFYTDFGTFPFSQLINTAAILTSDGASVSQHDIQQKIRDLIDQEDKRQPLSDQQLADLLKESGLPLARRTLSKYRQQLDIMPARQRKIK